MVINNVCKTLNMRELCDTLCGCLRDFTVHVYFEVIAGNKFRIAALDCDVIGEIISDIEEDLFPSKCDWGEEFGHTPFNALC